ncbi:hypothetical protein HOY80DRAFT_14872 [Tuber brumale]|nr:hypothetical protein HOY80DRAFT_14872 [Tuber brumale]
MMDGWVSWGKGYDRSRKLLGVLLLYSVLGWWCRGLCINVNTGGGSSKFLAQEPVLCTVYFFYKKRVSNLRIDLVPEKYSLTLLVYRELRTPSRKVLDCAPQ